MRALCDGCNKQIDTDGWYKGTHAFAYQIEVDTEPYIGTAYTKICNGYLCHDCASELSIYKRHAKR